MDGLPIFLSKHVSCVMCHVSSVRFCATRAMCHVSGVKKPMTIADCFRVFHSCLFMFYHGHMLTSDMNISSSSTFPPFPDTFLQAGE